MPPSLGQKLKQAREQLGLSLADVAHKTRIPVPRLHDLEEDNYNTFGSLTYARAFLQTYAGFVGVDANSVTDHMSPTGTPQQQTGTLAGGAIGAGTGALIGSAVSGGSAGGSGGAANCAGRSLALLANGTSSDSDAISASRPTNVVI